MGEGCQPWLVYFFSKGMKDWVSLLKTGKKGSGREKKTWQHAIFDLENLFSTDTNM